MAQVIGYHVLFYGGSDGYQTYRAQIELHGPSGPVAWVRFKDPGMVFQPDYQKDGVIRMHLPSSMFQSVLDVLRNEKPIQVYFAQERGFLGTASVEPVGEGE